MSEPLDRKRQERERKAALGMKWRGLWVYPEVWDAVRAFAEKVNRKHEREATQRAKGASAETKEP